MAGEAMEIKNTDLFDPLKGEFEQLKTQIGVSSADTQTKRKTFSESLKVFSKKFEGEKKTEFNRILTSISSGIEMNSEDIGKLDEMINTLSGLKYDQTELIAYKYQIDHINAQKATEIADSSRDIRSQAGVLASQVTSGHIPSQLTQEQEKIKGYITEFGTIKTEILDYKKAHPILSGFLIYALPEPLKEHFLNMAKIPQTIQKSTNSGLNGLLSMGSGFQNILDKVYSVGGQMMMGLGGLFAMFSPKFQQIVELREKIQSFWSKIPEKFQKDPEMLSKVFDAGTVKDMMSSIADPSKADKVTEVVDQKLEKFKAIVNGYLESFLAKKLGIDTKSEKWKIFIENWWKRTLGTGNKLDVKGNFDQIIEKIQNGKDDPVTMEFIFQALGGSVSVIFDFISAGVEAGVISPQAVAFEIAESGMNMALSSIMFFPNLLGIGLGKVTLEDMRTYLNIHTQIPESLRAPLLMFIYRALDSKVGWLFKQLAALPFHLAALITGQLSEDISKLGLWWEGMNGGVDKNLKLLADIETKLIGQPGVYSSLVGGEGKVGIISEYKKGLYVSYAYGQSQTVEEFKIALTQAKDSAGKAIFTEAELKSPAFAEILSMEEGSFKGIKGAGKLSGLVDGYAGIINGTMASHGNIGEALGKYSKGVFSQNNLIEEASRTMQRSLQTQSDLLRKDGIVSQLIRPYKSLSSIFDKIRAIPNSIDRTSQTNVLDLSRIMQDPKSLNEFKEKVFALIKFSPEAVKFLFGEFPVILLAKDQFEQMGKALVDGKPGSAAWELAQLFMFLTPIVGPICLAGEGGYEANIEGYTKMGIGAIWFGIDGVLLARGKLKMMSGINAIKNLGKTTAQGVTLTYNITRDIGKGVVSSLKGEANVIEEIVNVFKTTHGKGKAAIAAIVVGLGIYSMDKISEYYGDEKARAEFTNEITAKFASDGNPNEIDWMKLEEYVVANWTASKDGHPVFDENAKKVLVKFMILKGSLGITNMANIGVDIKDSNITINLTKNGDVPISPEFLEQEKQRMELVFANKGAGERVKFSIV